MGDINAHSSSWNPHYVRQQNVGSLEDLIDKYKLIINNNTDFPIRSRSQQTFIIDFALTTANHGLLTLWEILKKYPSVSNHDLILL